jgi:hemin uptake protein HemP
MNPPATPIPAAGTEHGSGTALLAKLDSASLFAGKRELIIVHQGKEYHLRITRQEKLILTK